MSHTHQTTPSTDDGHIANASAPPSTLQPPSNPQAQYLNFAKQKYPSHSTSPLALQGGCSFTILCISTCTQQRDLILQFRPLPFAIALPLAHEARSLYGHLAPETRELLDTRPYTFPDVQVCEMSVVVGLRLTELLLLLRLCASSLPDFSRPRISEDYAKKSRTLFLDLADFFARSWDWERRTAMNGKVGKTILPRLAKLARELPTLKLQCIARKTLMAVERGGLKVVPVALTHGDLLPSNLLVDKKTWELTGVVDWAEAEYLPFGMSLYGLEHLLGGRVRVGGIARFVYYEQADGLRDFFWACLCERVPALRASKMREAVELARSVGILLWNGFAWDNGRIDRVINAADDVEEMEYLCAFLGASAFVDDRPAKM